MTRHLLWLVIGAAALACSGPGSSDDDDDDGGSSGESGASSGGSSGNKGGTGSTNGGSTSGSSGSSGSGGSTGTGFYCVNVDTACICVESSPSLSGDECLTPKPTCCFAQTETNSCLCYPPDDPVCSLRGTTGYPSRTTCP